MSKKLLALLIILALSRAACKAIEPQDFPTPPASYYETVTAAAATAEPTKTDLNEIVSGQPFTLAVGESAVYSEADITLTFEKIERDGRCPSAVNCAEQGPVVVILSASQGKENVTTFTMNPDPNMAVFPGIPPNIVTYLDYEIELTAVEPYPVQPEDLMNLPYTATFILRRQ